MTRYGTGMWWQWTAGCIIMYLKIVQRNQNNTERNYKPSVEIKS